MPPPRVTIRITREIIQSSMQLNSRYDLIAASIKAAFPNAKAIYVDIGTIRWTDPDEGLRYVYTTPSQARAALIEFDQGITPEPFELALESEYAVTIAKEMKP